MGSRTKLLRACLTAAAATIVLGSLLVGSCERRLDRLARDDPDQQGRLADRVAAWVEAHAGGPEVQSPGGARFDGEWSLVTCQMATIGLARVALQDPSRRPRYREAVRVCTDWLLTEEARRFGTAAWGEDGVAAPSEVGHHVYLGYLNAALGAERLLDPGGPHAGPHDRITAYLARGLELPVHRNQTYPGEVYPADLAVAAASVALHAEATGVARAALLEDWSRRFRAAAVDPTSGMLVQSLSPRDGSAGGGPRGSSTALAAWFLADVDPELAAELHRALPQRRVLGFGAAREYPVGTSGVGDIDSGPVVMGVSVAATGFAIGSARRQGDTVTFRRLVRTSTLFGVPVRGWHLAGGGLGNALMLALLTA